MDCLVCNTFGFCRLIIATDWWTGRGVVGGEAARAGQLRVGRGRGLSGREEATAILIDVRSAGGGWAEQRSPESVE